MKKQVLFISQTALMLALLIVMQAATRSMSQFVTGALVNMVLLVSTFIVGLSGGLIVALASPLLAFMLGMGPMFVQIIVFVALGNAVLVSTAWLLAHKNMGSNELKDKAKTALSLVAAAALKTLFLWVGLVKVALPLIPGLKEPQIAVISVSFSWPQLITGLLGGCLALLIIPVIKRANKR